MLQSWVESGHGPGAEEKHDSLSDELLALAGDPAPVDLRQVLMEAVAVVQPLAQRTAKLVALPAVELEDGESVLADRAILKQLLVQLLSYAVQTAVTQVTVSWHQVASEGEALVTIGFRGSIVRAQERRLTDAQRIAASQGMACDWVEQPPGEVQVTLTLDRGNPVSVLVVEDNPGAVELYRRYLSSRNWQLHGVSDPRVAHEVARRTQPDVMVLDIMMPKLDGWSVLQSLRRDPGTSTIPVLVCSVVDDPELAAALGARAHLTKPVSQGQFLAAIRRCLEKDESGQTHPEPPRGA